MSPAGFNDFDGFSDRRPGGDHVIDDHDMTFDRSSDSISALAVILDFFAVVSKRQVVAEFGHSHGNGGRQSNAFICRAEDHIAFDTPILHRLDQSASVKVCKL